MMHTNQLAWLMFYFVDVEQTSHASLFLYNYIIFQSNNVRSMRLSTPYLLSFSYCIEALNDDPLFYTLLDSSNHNYHHSNFSVTCQYSLATFPIVPVQILSTIQLWHSEGHR